MPCPNAELMGKLTTHLEVVRLGLMERPHSVQITASASGSGGSVSTGKGDSLSPAGSPSGSSSGDCIDTPPSGSYTCQQQVSRRVLELYDRSHPK